MAVAVGLALLMPSIDAGSDIDNATVTTLPFSLAGGLIALIALVFSLLFLVVPYADTGLTPRLTLFRDDPVVWRSFAYFVALFVQTTVSGLALSNDSEVSVLVAIIAMLLGSSPPLRFGRCSSAQSARGPATICRRSPGRCAGRMG